MPNGTVNKYNITVFANHVFCFIRYRYSGILNDLNLQGEKLLLLLATMQ